MVLGKLGRIQMQLGGWCWGEREREKGERSFIDKEVGNLLDCLRRSEQWSVFPFFASQKLNKLKFPGNQSWRTSPFFILVSFLHGKYIY
jgi:hypothetical protein